MVLVGEQYVVQHLDRPTQIALVEGCLGQRHRSVGTAHRGDVALGRSHRRMWPQVRRVAVVPAEVALVDRLHVVADRSVVAVRVPLLGQRRRHLEHLGDLRSHVAEVHQTQRLVVEVGVHVALHRQELDRTLTSPGRPVVRREHDLEVVAPQIDRLGDVGRPPSCIAHLGAAQRDDVVQRVRGVLRSAQRLVVGEVEVHLRRCFGAGCHLEHDPHAVDRELLAGVGDVDRGRDQRRLPGRGGLAEPASDLPVGSLGERRAVHEVRSASHRRADEHVLGDRFLHEALRCDHRDTAGVDVGFVDHALHATEVVDVGVRVDHRHDVAWPAVLLVERPGSGGGLLADQRVDHDDAGVAFDHTHHREVEPSQLVDTRHHLEQAVADQQLPLAPQAGVGGVAGRLVEEAVGVEVPDHTAVGSRDLSGGRPGDEAAFGVVEVLRVAERESRCVHAGSLAFSLRPPRLATRGGRAGRSRSGRGPPTRRAPHGSRWSSTPSW